MADDGRILIVAALAALGGPFLFFYGFRRLRLRHAIAGTPTSKIRGSAMGRVELKGLALEDGSALCAPFSGKACVWFKWQVEEERKDHKGRSSWHNIASGESREAFILDDATGRARVLPEGAEIDSPKLLGYTSGGFFSGAAPAGPEAATWIGKGGLFSRRRRLSEWRIDPQRPVYVLGVQRPPLKDEGKDGLGQVTRGRNEEPFFISTENEETLLRSLMWKVWGCLVFGAGLCIAGVAFMVWRFVDK